MYDSNFHLILQLQYSKCNTEDIAMTYIISGRGSVLLLTDSNLSMYYVFITLKIIAIDTIFTMILSGYRPYTTSRSFSYKTYTSLLSTVHYLNDSKKEDSIVKCSFKSMLRVFLVGSNDFLGYLPWFFMYFVLIMYLNSL